MENKNVRRVVALVVQRPDGKILLLKRSPDRPYDPNKWSIATGHIEAGEPPHEAATRELKEELGIDAKPSKAGRLIEIGSYEKPLHVYTFLFSIDLRKVELNAEHTDYSWIEPKDIFDYDRVYKLEDDLAALDLL
ncbi:NUDIX hydrolase [Candidatus Dojkabacteria bacterium]|nr:NUDIX hydrolase [Candidatus Dojkabacteria bacterium]